MITITEVGDGPPVVTTAGLSDVGIQSSPEGDTPLGGPILSATYSVVQGGGLIEPGNRAVFLTEPGSSVVSDFVVINVTAVGIFGHPILTEFVVIGFQSEGHDFFDFNVNTVRGLNPPSIAEDGTLQDISALLNSGPLIVKVSSDSLIPGEHWDCWRCRCWLGRRSVGIENSIDSLRVPPY
jgi:hypothetical protein